MSTTKTMDRKSFLASAVSAWAAVTLSGCSDEGSDGGGTGGSTTGGSATGGTTTGGTTTGGTMTGGTTTGGTTTGGNPTGGSPTGGSSTGGSSTGGTGGQGEGGEGGEPSFTVECMADTNNGMHSHPLVVPGTDVINYFQEEPYTLEDGGTGHTHTLALTAYDYIELSQGGTGVTRESSTDAGHSHMCIISCIVTEN